MMDYDEDTTILLNNDGEAVEDVPFSQSGLPLTSYSDVSSSTRTRDDSPSSHTPSSNVGSVVGPPVASAAPSSWCGSCCGTADDNMSGCGGGSGLVLWASLVAATGGLLFGYDVGVISGALLQMQRDLQLSCSQREAVVSVMMAGALLASIVGGSIVDSVGRKVAIILNAVLFIVGAGTLAAAHTFTVIVLGRFLVGFAVSLSAISECVYISEIAPDHRRGMLVSLNELAITIGFLASYLAGYLFVDVHDGWRFMFGLALIPAVFQAVGMVFLPRTPHFLLLRRKDKQAEDVLQRLTGSTDVKQQLTRIRLMVSAQREARCSHVCSPRQNMTERMLIGAGLVLFQQCTGQPSLLNYAPTVLQLVGFCGESAATMATVGLGVVKVISTSVALLYVDRAGRRKFLLSGSLLMCVCLLVLAAVTSVHQSSVAMAAAGHQSLCSDDTAPTAHAPTVFDAAPVPSSLEPLPTPLPFIQHQQLVSVTTAAPSINQTLTSSINSTAICAGGDGWQFGWLPLVTLLSLMGYVTAYAIGFGPMTWLVLSEIYPSAIKGRAVAAATSLNWLSNMLIAATFLQAVEYFSISGLFVIYAVMSLLSAVFVFLVVPETRNKSLHEISDDLNRRRLVARARAHVTRCCHDNKRRTRAYSVLSDSFGPPGDVIS